MSCKLSPTETIFMACRSLFSEKNKKQVIGMIEGLACLEGDRVVVIQQ